MKTIRQLNSVVLLVFFVFLFSGCAMQTAVNEQIATANVSRFAAYTDGMIGCGDDASCKLGLSMAFAGGLGQQHLYREDSVADILRAGVPYFDITDRMVSRLVKSSRVGDSSGLAIIGDNNTVSGVGNKLTATEGSSTSLATDQSINRPSAVSYGAGDTTLTPEVVTVEIPAEAPAEEVPIE